MMTMVINNEPWFVNKDVAMMLGYERANNAIRSHVEEEDKLMHQISASGQRRQMTIINESGLYALILSSKLPEAKDFKRWVASEVLGYAKPENALARHVDDEDKLNNISLSSLDRGEDGSSTRAGFTLSSFPLSFHRRGSSSAG